MYCLCHALIADPDPETRMRLLQATSAVPFFNAVRQFNNLNDSLQSLKGEDGVDIVFLSHRFKDKDIISFVEKAKGTPSGAACAYVLVLPARDQDAPTVNRHISTTDGFLFEPYSVNGLMEIAELAEKIKAERAEEKARLGIKFMVSEIMNQLDLVAFLRSHDSEPGKSWKMLKDLCAAVRELDEAGTKRYFEIMVDQFIDAPDSSERFKIADYSGVSRRVKRRLEDKLISDLNAPGGIQNQRRRVLVKKT